jgi:hypothetical protein
MHNRFLQTTMLVAMLILCLSPARLSAQKVGCNKYAYILGKEHIPGMPKYWMGYGLTGMDVNKDGYTDVLAGAVGPNTVFVYFGGRGIFDSTADLELRGGGEMVTGDFNGDGLTDLVTRRLNSEWAQQSPISYDTFYVYMGVKDSLYAIETEPRYVITCPVKIGNPGATNIGQILLAGDLDGDGRDELLMGSTQWDTRIIGELGAGAIFVWRYPGDEDSDSLTRLPLSDSFATDVRYIRLGDINGDGIADLVVVTREMADVGVMKGKFIRVSYGKPGRYPDPSNPEQLFTLEDLKYSSTYLVDRSTYYWVTLLDANRDGLTDLTWVPCKDSLLIMYGTPEGLSGTVDRIIVNPDTNRWFGFGLDHHSIGDHNGDGHDDYILDMGTEEGNWPALVVFGGNTYGLTNQPISVCVGGGHLYGRYVVNLGDLNGDGADEHIHSNPVAPGSFVIQDPGYCVVVESSFWVKVGVETESDPPVAPFSVEVYPAPSSGDITLLLKDEAPGEYQLKMYALDGKVILTRNYQLVNRGNVIVLQAGDYASDFSPGVHFIELRSATGSVTRKVVLVKK